MHESDLPFTFCLRRLLRRSPRLFNTSEANRGAVIQHVPSIPDTALDLGVNDGAVSGATDATVAFLITSSRCCQSGYLFSSDAVSWPAHPPDPWQPRLKGTPAYASNTAFSCRWNKNDFAEHEKYDGPQPRPVDGNIELGTRANRSGIIICWSAHTSEFHDNAEIVLILCGSA